MLDGVIFEAVFRNVQIDALDELLDLDDSVNRAHARIVPERDLRRVSLTTDGLHRLKVPKANLTTGAPIDSLGAARRVEGIHHQFPALGARSGCRGNAIASRRSCCSGIARVRAERQRCAASSHP